MEWRATVWYRLRYGDWTVRRVTCPAMSTLRGAEVWARGEMQKLGTVHHEVTGVRFYHRVVGPWTALSPDSAVPSGASRGET